MSSTNEKRHGPDLPMVNRASVVLEATQVYVDWANNCPGGGPKLVLSEMRDDQSTVYLIPEMDFGPEEWLRENYLSMFEEELYAWHTRESDWPKDRSFEAFRRFFKVRFHSMVLDMGRGRIRASRT
jgi:hypothetical protein